MKIKNILTGTVLGLAGTFAIGVLILLLDIVLFVVSIFTNPLELTMPFAEWYLANKWIILPALIVVGGLIGAVGSDSTLKKFFLGLLCGGGAAVVFGLVAALVDLVIHFINILVYAWGARIRYMPWYFSNFFTLLLILFIVGTTGGFCYAYYRMKQDQKVQDQMVLKNEALKTAREAEDFCRKNINTEGRELEGINPQFQELLGTAETEFAGFCVLLGRLDALTERLQQKGEKNP